MSNTIDTVYMFSPGTGQNSGQEPQYYPKNIFGLPSTNASYELPESSPEQILSLGMGGEIIIGIKNFQIVNGEGPDFTIFENCFFNPVSKKLFAEPAKVAVSNDGVNFIEFPYNDSTLKGLAGITPVNGNKDPYNPKLSGGDSFDLSDIGMDFITHVKLTDVTHLIEDLFPDNIYYQPPFILSGFDLDAVVALHTKEIGTSHINSTKSDNIQILKKSNSLIIKNPEKNTYNLKLYDYMGNQLLELAGKSDEYYTIDNLKIGLYLTIMQHKNEIMTNKFVITK